MSERIQAEIDNSIGEIAKVISLIETFGERHRLPEAVVGHLTLACDELLTNIVFHGFPDGRLHKILVSIALDGNKLEAEIIDDGIAFDPLARPTPDVTLATEHREIGGLGIHFIRTVMDRVDYRRSNGQNHLKMVKRMPGRPVKGRNPWHTTS